MHCLHFVLGGVIWVSIALVWVLECRFAVGMAG